MTEEKIRNSRPSPYLPYSQSLALGLVTLWVVYLCVIIMKPFVAVLAWAVALAVATQPLASWLKRQIKSSSLASFIALVIGALTICLPTLWVARLIIQTTLDTITSLIESAETATWIDPSNVLPRLRPSIGWIEQHLHLQEMVTNFVELVASRLPRIVTISLIGAVHFLLVLFTAFFFIRDGQLFLSYLKWAVPLAPLETEKAVYRVFDTVHVCLFGIVLMAALQGALGGLIFWWLQLPHPTLWGLAMGCLAIVPYLGAFIIWIPASIGLALHGEWNAALILIAWGALVIGLADNVLYPFMVGKRLHYHTLLVFFFLFGGVLVFGSSGVIVGPMIMSVAHGLVEVWQHQGASDTARDPEDPSSDGPVMHKNIVASSGLSGDGPSG